VPSRLAKTKQQWTKAICRNREIKLLVMVCLSAPERRTRHGLTIGEQAIMHSQSRSAEMKVGVLEAMAPPCRNSSGQRTRDSGPLCIASTAESSYRELEWLAVCAWR
jgi:hypothetical protein